MAVLKLWATRKPNLDFEDITVRDNQLYFDTSEKTFYIGVGKDEYETVSVGSELEPASETTLGGIKIGSGLAIDQDGFVSVVGDSGFSGSYDDLVDKPDLSIYQLSATAFSGNYNDLTNKPALFSGNYNDLTNKPALFSGNYNDLTNKPNLALYQLTATAFSGNYNDLTNKPNLALYQLTATAFSGNYNDLTNKPTIPTDVNQLTDNSNLLGGNYVLPTASDVVLGGIKIGSGLAISESGVVSVTSPGTTDYNNLINKPFIPSKTSDLSNDAGFITANQVPQTFGFSVGADDSVLRPIGAGESIKFIGINGISTGSDLEGNITISGSYNLDTVTDAGNTTSNSIGVGAITTSGNILPTVDNSLFLGSAEKRWHTVFVGPGSVDIAGAKLQKIGNNLAINAPLRFADSSVQSTAPHFFIAGQDSSAIKVNNGETIKFIGGNGIATALDAEGNFTFNVTAVPGESTAPIKTFNIINEFSAPLLGKAIFVPAQSDTIRSVILTNSSIVSGDLMVGLYRNNELLNFFSIPSGYFTFTYSNLNFVLNTNDYVTVNVVAGSGSNFSLALYNFII